MVPLDGGKSQRSRGGGGRAPRAQSMGGALGPAHALVLRVWGALGPPRPAKRRRPPRRTPTATCYPHASTLPSALQRWPGGAQEGPGVPTGGGGVWGSGAARRAAPLPQTKERGPGPKAPGPLFQGASRPAAAVRKGRWAWPPRRLPSTPLRTGLPPRCIRHWRRSAPPPLRRVFHQRQKDPKKRLPQTKRAAPDERRASIIRRKTGKVFQLVFPRFFKSGWGSGGKAPGKIQRYPQRPYAVSISKAASRRHTQNTSRAASSSATGGRLGAMRILLSWGSLP